MFKQFNYMETQITAASHSVRGLFTGVDQRKTFYILYQQYSTKILTQIRHMWMSIALTPCWQNWTSVSGKNLRGVVYWGWHKRYGHPKARSCNVPIADARIWNL